jgi:hypothetical protein
MKQPPKIVLPQPKALQELHVIRARIHRKARKRGWENYLAALNQHAGHLLAKPLTPSPAQPAAPARASRQAGLARFG